MDLLQRYDNNYDYVVIDKGETYSYVFEEPWCSSVNIGLKLTDDELKHWVSGYSPGNGTHCRILRYKHDDVLIETRCHKRIVLIGSKGIKPRKEAQH